MKKFKLYQNRIGDEYFNNLKETKNYLLDILDQDFSVSLVDDNDEEDENVEYDIEFNVKFIKRKNKTV